MKDISLKETTLKDTLLKDTSLKDTSLKDTSLKDTLLKEHFAEGHFAEGHFVGGPSYCKDLSWLRIQKSQEPEPTNRVTIFKKPLTWRQGCRVETGFTRILQIKEKCFRSITFAVLHAQCTYINF